VRERERTSVEIAKIMGKTEETEDS
jgi:hypothetical protein